MSRDVAQRALQLFERAIDLQDDELTEFMAQTCGDSSELRQRVEALLASQQDATDLFPSVDTNADPDLAPRPGSTPDVFSVGTLVNERYEVNEVIGRGGMGTVYRATDNRLNRVVAVKTLRYEGLQQTEMQRRFDREMKSVAALSHPNIVTLYDVGIDAESAYAVMEFVPGNTLRQVIRTGLDWQTAVRLASDVATGLAAAHDLNMMHRDIKPENIVVDGQGRAKILDFGLARPEESAGDQNITLGNVAPGTVPYMSPEQAENEELTCSTDVFSLGTVLYEALTGTNPFRADTLLRTLRNVAAAEPRSLRTLNEDVPDSVAAVVHNMLSLDCDKRPTARVVARQLQNLNTTVATDVNIKQSLPSQRASSWQPSLAVLPFETLGEDTELETVADGLVVNLTTVLTRIPLTSLVSRTSSLAMKGKSASPEEIRQLLGVDYIVEGSLQRMGSLIRANVQLIETEQGNHLWSQQFDCTDDDAITTNLLHNVLARLEPQLVRAIFDQLSGEQGELSSRQLLMQAMSVLSLKGWHVDSFTEAAELLRQAIELEPNFALSHAFFALTRGLSKRVGLAVDPEMAEREAEIHAEKALDLEDMDSNVLGLAGCALSDVGQTERALPILRNAIDLNPNNAQAHAALGAAHLAMDEWPQAIEHLVAGINLSPLDGRLAVWYAMLAIAYIQQGQLQLALESSEKGCQSNRKTYMPRVVLTAVQLLLGDTDKAAAAMKETLRVKPDLSQGEIISLLGPNLGAAVNDLRSTQV